MHECFLYKKLKNKTVVCQNCPHYCVLKNGQKGICAVRQNINGKLYCLNYGKLSAIEIDPIEKKPLFHFFPGTKSLSIATAGCNFSCYSCQNWILSQGPKIFGKVEGEKILPKEIIKIAKENNTPSISYTYTEPTIFSDYAFDIMKLAKKSGLKNIWISNGFWSKELFELISSYLDAANIDLKSFSGKFYKKYCGGNLEPVLKTIKRLKKKKIWTEITTLIIPGFNDSKKELKEIANFIRREIGSETPWHISRFSGEISWKFKDVPDTPIETLEKAYKIGKKAGLKYVYVGNVPGSELEHTFCPRCGFKAIERIGYSIIRRDKEGKCPACGENLNLILN